MAASETTQARQAALLLYGLPPAVRRQVVARLDVAESNRLKPLLDELAELGVSQSLGQQLHHLASPPQPATSQPTLQKPTVQEQVERLSAEDVVRCLQPCAPVTVARLLRAGAWPWKTQVLDLMPDARRAEVLEHMRSESPALAPAVLASLCEHLCLHATYLCADRPQVSGPPANRRAASWWPAVRWEVRASLRRLIGWMR